MSKANVKKVVLAYSGGLDTSVIVPWLKENYGCEVVCFTADVGQGDEMGGLEATRRLKERLPATRVIVLTMHADEIHVQNAVQSGASGYILKEDTVEHLIRAIRTVAGGKPYYSPRIRSIIEKSH